MKRFTAIILIVLLPFMALAESFESWMKRVYRIAPAYDLELHQRDPILRESEREWFYLYYWQGNFTPRQAVIATVDHEKHCALCQSRRTRKE